MQTVVRGGVGRVELVEGLDQKRAAAAGRVEQANRTELVLPRFPELDQRGSGGGLQVVELVDVRIGQRRSAGPFLAADASWPLRSCWKRSFSTPPSACSMM